MIRRFITVLTVALLLAGGISAMSSSLVAALPTGVTSVAADNPNLLFGQTCDDPKLKNSDVCQNVEANPSNPIFGKGSILATAINILAIIVAVAAVIMIIVSGIRYMLSSGDPANINSAKSGLIYAVVGIVVAAVAQSIVIFVLNRAG